jgi:AcrR family transcriptional regulator
VSSEAALAVPRRLSRRQQSTVTDLLEATLAHIRAHGHQNLSVRAVAERAGVTHTTAYTYFSSKEHLLAELFWRSVRSIPDPEPDLDLPMPARLTAALRGIGLLLADEPALAEASLSALLAPDPDVVRVRTEVGADFLSRIGKALGPDRSPELVQALSLAFSGAMLQAGMGYFDFPGVIDRMASVATLLDPHRTARRKPARR